MSNKAAWAAEKGAALKVDDAPMPKIKPGHVILRNKAVAINPIDWKMRDLGIMVKSWPLIPGTDVAGEIVEVAEGVEHVKPGDRVIGFACALVTANSEDAAFQLYTAVPANLVSKLPASIPYELAVVLPVTLSCAAAGLYEKNALGLPLPGSNANGTVLIWGGSSSVGSSAIQLARASGLKVISTCSTKNFDYVKKLGADRVFDYADPDVVKEIVDALRGGCAGIYDTVGLATAKCAEIAQRLGGGHIVSPLPVPRELPEGVTATNVFATSIERNDIGKAIYQDFLPKALSSGSFVPSPAPKIIGHGLEALDQGLNDVRKGVSATKLVVVL